MKRCIITLLTTCTLSMPAVRAMEGPPPVLNPRTYQSGSGEFSVHVDPSDLHGRGAAEYQFAARGKPTVSRRLPFTLWDAGITDTGRVVGYAYSHGWRGFSEEGYKAGMGNFSVVLITPTGVGDLITYHGDYEYVGKAAARCDDVLNWVPARLTGLLVVVLASLRGTTRIAWSSLREERRLSGAPNKLWTIAPMAGALRVRLCRPGSYAVGQPVRPLTTAVIGEAAALVWAGGGVVIAVAAVVAGFVAWAVW